MRRGRAAALVVTAGLAVSGTGCLPAARTAVPAAPSTTVPNPPRVAPWPVMGEPRVTADQLVAWFRSKRTSGYAASVPVDELARLYLEEGRASGVAGDLAFVQAVLETGWFRFSDRVPGSFNNFAGIGAHDGGTGAAAFGSARLGVRAHVQFLRAYADPHVTVATLGHPPVSPRWAAIADWVNGKAPLWSQFGNGTWASSAEYAPLIDRLYRDLAAHAGVRVK